MSYLVSPDWVYWLQIIGGIRGVFFGAIIVGVVFLSGMLRYMLCEDIFYELKEWCKTPMARTTLVVMIVTFVAILGIIFIPTSQTLIYMKIATFATEENLEEICNTLKETVASIIQMTHN